MGSTSGCFELNECLDLNVGYPGSLEALNGFRDAELRVIDRLIRLQPAV
jgi:hypothetical protein